MHDFIAGLEFMRHGGFMMYPLLISALVGLTVIFERLYVFRKRYASSPEVVVKAMNLVRGGKLSEALKLCHGIHTPVASVIATGIEHFSNPIEEMELAMKNQGEAWVPVLEKRIEIIDTVITAAPLMGLLGTITGMIAAFQVLSDKGVSAPNAITGGIAEALIATATGIVIALVCLFAYNYITAQIKLFIYQVESAGSRLVEARHAHERSQGQGGKK